MLEAIRADEPVVLLIDEVDRVEIETEALLLEVLSDFQVSIPELGTIEGKQRPLVFLTSNNTRELSEALKRRCLFLHIDYPEIDREKEIVRVRVPEVDAALADQIAKVVALDPQHRPEEVAVDLGDDRLGAHARRTSAATRSRPRCSATRCTCCSSTRATSPRRARSWASTRPSVVKK